MPLRGIVEGKDVIAPFLDEEEWNDLKQRVKTENLDVRIPCCGNPAYLRTSKHGYHHFVHKRRGDCTSKSESWQHMKAKQEIVRECRAAGYHAKTEIDGDGWRADVLAVRDNAKIAFEVQWSSQTWEVTQERQQKFSDVGVRGCWLFKTPPSGYRANRDVPLFKIEVTEDTCMVVFNPQSYYDWQKEEHQRLEIGDFLKSLLSGRINFCEHITAKHQSDLEIQFFNSPCWNCGAFYDVYRVLNTFESNCGQSLRYHLYTYNPDSDLNFAFHPEIQQAVREYVSQNGSYELAKSMKYYRQNRDSPIDAFQCPHCDTLLGHKYLMEIYRIDKAKRGEVITLPIEFKNPPSIYEEDDHWGALHGHWCYPENKVFCCK